MPLLINFPRLIQKTDYKNTLKLLMGASFAAYTVSMMLAALTVMMADQANAQIAGIFMAALNLIEMLLLDPIGGAMADTRGSRQTLKYRTILNMMAGALLMIFSQSLLLVIAVGITIFVSFGLNNVGTYLLRTTDRKEGGTIFGIADNVISLAILLGTFSLPFFIQNRAFFWLGVALVICNAIYFLILQFVKDDIAPEYKQKIQLAHINPIATARKAWTFVRKNNNYPLMLLATAAYTGFFYGTIWFVIPLKFATSGSLSLADGLELGIYELVTVVTAGICGHLADKLPWKRMHLWGWVMTLIGMWLIPFFPLQMGLIIAGLIIGLGNNIFYYAACHALEQFDDDHRADGTFWAFVKMIQSASYAVVPLVCGFFYQFYGFVPALVFGISLSSIIAIWMIIYTLRLPAKS